MKNRRNGNDETERFITQKRSEFSSDPATGEVLKEAERVDFPERKKNTARFEETELVDFPARETDSVGVEETGPVNFPEHFSERPTDAPDSEMSKIEKEILDDDGFASFDEDGFASFTDEELDGVYDELEQSPANIGHSPGEIELPESVISDLEKKIADAEGFSSFSEDDDADAPKIFEYETKKTAFEQIDPSDIGLIEFQDDSDTGFLPFTDSGTDLKPDDEPPGNPIDFTDHREQVAEAWEGDEEPRAVPDPKFNDRKPEKGKYLKIALLSALFPVLVVCILIVLENRGYIALPVHIDFSKVAGKTSHADRAIEKRVSHPAKQPVASNTKKPKAIIPKADSPDSDPIHEKLLAVNEIIGGLSSKRDEITTLISQYQDGIESVRAEILEAAQKTGGVSFRHVSENKKIMLGLASVRRRMAYIAELERISGDLLFAAEELLYIRRITEIDMTIVDFAEGMDMEMIRARLDTAIDTHFGKAESIVFQADTDQTATLESVWDRLFGKKWTDSAKKVPAGSIEQEIRSGQYGRRFELTELSPETAQYLAEWDGKVLYLGGISSLTPGAAKHLAEWRGDWLILNGLDTLSPETAEQLFRWNGNRLSLNGISKMSLETIRSMAQWKGKNIELASLATLSEKNQDSFAELEKWEASGGKLYLSDALRSRLDGMAGGTGK